MTGGQEYSRHQKGIINRYYEHSDTIALQRLGEIVSDLYLAEGSSASRLWNNARQALAKLAPPDDPHVQKVLTVRSVAGLAKLVTELNARGPLKPADDRIDESSSPTKEETSPASVAASQPHRPSESAATPTPDQLKQAMKAFRKRLKLTRLDEESRLGRSPMSGGKQSGVVAIMPPREFPQAVWDELVRQGKLRKSGSFYQLSEGG